MKKINLVIVLLFFSSILFAQSSNCKVINEELKGIYKGECKSGLAHGSGVFTFESGMFIYIGEFANGKMHGKGEIYSLINNEKKLVSKGFWNENVFSEEKSLKPYDVKRKVSVERNTVKKLDEGNRIFFSFFRNGVRNNVGNLNIVLSSGNPMSGSSIYGYENVEFPVRCEITYTTANKINRASFPVRYEVVINEPGEWEVSLYN